MSKICRAPQLKSLTTKLLLSFFVFLILIFSFAPPAYAQDWYSQSPAEWYVKVYDEKTSPASEIFGERYTAAQVEWVIYSVLTWLPTKILGPKIMSCGMSLLFSQNATPCLNLLLSSASFVQPVASSNQSLLSEITEDRPLSGITYVKNLGRKFHLIPEANAQGFGFQYALDPVLTMWKASRNIAYSLLILVTVILAFMIMFRVKISPQIVISIQSAIPKLALALILITFSYAIAGFLVDLMYVFIGLVSLIGKNFFPINIPAPAIFNFLTKGQPFNGVNVQIGAFGLMAMYIILFYIVLVFNLFTSVGLIGAGLIVAIGIVGLVSPAGAILVIIALLIFVVIGIAFLLMALKVLWMLLKAYASVLLLTILAPFQILLGVLTPNFGFGSWLKSFISSLSTFVVTGVLFLLSYAFLIQGFMLTLEGFAGTELSARNAVETIINTMFGTGAANVARSLLAGGSNTAWPPLLGVGTASSALLFISPALLFIGTSFVIFTMIPKAADLIQSFIQGKPFAYGTAVGEVTGLPGKIAAVGLKGISIGTEVGKAWTTRFGTRTAPSPPPPPTP